MAGRAHPIGIDRRKMASIELPAVVNAGDPLTGVLEILEIALGVREAVVRLLRHEVFEKAEPVVFEVALRKVDMNGFVAKRFAFQVPLETVASFVSDFFTVSYVVEVKFGGDAGEWRWAGEVTIAPPLVSLTKPRVAKAKSERV
jgi:hypothetical protein